MLLGLTYNRDHARRSPLLQSAVLQQLRPDVVRIPVESVTEGQAAAEELARRSITVGVVSVPIGEWSAHGVELVVRRAVEAQRSGRVVVVELRAGGWRRLTARAYAERVVAIADNVGGRLPVVVALGSVVRDRAWAGELAAFVARPEAFGSSREVVDAFRSAVGGVSISMVGEGWPSRWRARSFALAVRDVFPRHPLHVEVGWHVGRDLTRLERLRLRLADLRKAAPRVLDEAGRDLWLRAAWSQWQAVGAEALIVRGYDETFAGPYDVVSDVAGARRVAVGWRELRLAGTRGLGPQWAHH